MADLRLFANTSNIVRFILKHSTTGQGLTGLTSASAGLIISTIADNEATATAYTQAGSTIETITTLGTFATPTATKCRFKEVDATNHKGLYEFQFADARFAVASSRRLIISVTGATSLLDTDYEIQLVQFNPYDAVRLGLTALPNAAAGAAGGLSADIAAVSVLITAVKAKTDQLVFTIANKVDSSIQAAGDFAQAAADKAWSTAARVLTAGTNIVLAKGTGVTGFNDLSAAQVNTEVDTALTDYDAPTSAELILEINAVQVDIAALNNLSAAQIKTQVVDALNVDTYAEPGQEAPPATTTLAKKLNYVYKAFRNRKTQTATTLSLYADNGTTVDQKATISDDGTTYDHSEIGAGP